MNFSRSHEKYIFQQLNSNMHKMRKTLRKTKTVNIEIKTKMLMHINHTRQRYTNTPFCCFMYVNENIIILIMTYLKSYII